jgi:hypothetical protein
MLRRVKGVLGAGFMRPQGHYKCSKMTQGDNKVYYRPIIKKHFSKFPRFFDFFLSIFFKMNFKNYICYNLTTKTSKYHLDLIQLSDQCFRGFPLSLLLKKSKHIYLGSKFEKKTFQRSFLLICASVSWNLGGFQNIT